MATATKLITADELLNMGDIGRCELIHGELVMMSPAGFGHGDVALRIGMLLGNFVYKHGLGKVLAAETGYEIEPDLVCAPDVSFVRSERVPVAQDGFFDGVPDIAVEVLSPNDRKRQVTEKINMWLAHGTSVVWLANPKEMTLSVHRVGEVVKLFRCGDSISDEPLLPGFILSIDSIFKMP